MSDPRPSVTEVLDILNKPALVQWSANVGVEYMKEMLEEKVIKPTMLLYNEARDASLLKAPDFCKKIEGILNIINEAFMAETTEIVKAAKTEHKRKKEEAANRGKRLHSAIEKFLQANDGAAVDVDEDLVPGFRKFMSWWILNDVKVIEVECPVWSDEGGGYKGTFDLAAILKENNKELLYLIDIKSTPRIYDEVYMQIAAYFYGWKARTSWIPDRGGILRLDFSGQAEEFTPILESDLSKYYQAFLKLVEFWHLTRH